MADSTWSINTDIYDIVGSVDNLKKRYIDDESETTLALGTFGFLTDTEAKKIQIQTIMAGELGNEMFPTRAKLSKNVLTHAAYSSIGDILASPARITINLGILASDLEKYFVEDRFTIDSYSGIFIGDYEFHLDYDVILSREKKNKTATGYDSYSYTAQYKMMDENGQIVNRLSPVVNQYIMQPFLTVIDSAWYLIFQVMIHQYTIEITNDKIISDSIIENRNYSFTFENQLADFDVYVTTGSKVTKLRPFLYGSDPGDEKYYCWYLFLSDNTIRITFDRLSFTPGVNDEIEIRAYTTLGTKGNFEYIKVDDTSEGFFFTLTSEKYDYSGLGCYAVAVTDSLYGTDQKTKADLQKMIPKASMSRGSLTTEADINNYFNLIEDENNRLKMQPKVDNQLTRVWYAYMLLKDQYGDVLPSNTIKIHIDLEQPYWSKSPDGRIIIPAGMGIVYDSETQIGEIVDIAELPSPVDNDDYYGSLYYYVTFYSIILCRDPLYSAFYCTCVDDTTFFKFYWINSNSDLQFVANRVNYHRNLLTDQYMYHISFALAQSLLVDYGLFNEEEVTTIEINPETGAEEFVTRTVQTINIKVILVLYNKSDVPYRWQECTLDTKAYKASQEEYIYNFYIDLVTDNGLDDSNQIKINDMYVRGSRDIAYGYFPDHAHARIYVLGRFDSETHPSTDRGIGADCLDKIAPGYEDWVVTNIYDFQDKINFFDNYTDVIDAKVDSLDEEGLNFNVSGIPVVGAQYINIDYDDVEDNAAYLMDAITEKKSYIDYCLELLENTMDIDFKLFNTYGPSFTYMTENGDSINHIDIVMNFQVSLKYSSDFTTKDKLIEFIKGRIEDLNDTGDFHIPNLITEVTNEFKDYINYIEFIGFNGFDPSVQHILLKDIEEPTTVPEFLNVRNTYIGDAKNLEPCINIEIV